MESTKNTFIRSLKQSPWTLLIVATRGLGSLGIMKIVAVFFGSSGIALFSHFQNLISLVTQVPDQGNNLGIIRLYSLQDDNKKRILIGLSFLLNCILFVLVTAAILIRKDFFLKYFDSFSANPLYLWIVIGCVFFVLLNSLAFSFIYARQAFKLLFGITIANMLILVFAVYQGSVSNDVQFAMLAFAAGWAIYSIINFIVLTATGNIPRIAFKWDRDITRSLLQFLGIALVSVLLSKWVDYFVRDFALGWFGSETTGHWQAQVRLSDSYRSLFMGTLGVIFYSQISKMDLTGFEGKSYIRRMLGLATLSTLFGLLIVWLFRKQFILLLFQTDLLPAADFIHFQLLADLFALPSFLLVFLLIALGKWSQFIALHLASAFLYLLGVSSLLGLTDIGISGIPLANAIRFLLFLILLLIVNRKVLR